MGGGETYPRRGYGIAEGWIQKPASYKGSDLSTVLDALEIPLTKGLFELVHEGVRPHTASVLTVFVQALCIKPDVLAKKVEASQMQKMIGENIAWLSNNSDLSVLLP